MDFQIARFVRLILPISQEPLIALTCFCMQNEREDLLSLPTHRTVALIQTEILRKIGVAFFFRHTDNSVHTVLVSYFQKVNIFDQLEYILSILSPSSL